MAYRDPFSTKSTSRLLELAQIISDSAKAMDRVCEEKGFTFPSLDEPFTPQSEAFRADPEANEAASRIAAAALQLVASVMPPPATMFWLFTGDLYTAALRVCLEGNVTEILREGGANGLHVDEIAVKAKLPSNKLGRIIRYLSSQHVYKEVKPDVFMNTRLSSMMDTGKSVEEVLADPKAKHDNTHGFPALMGYTADDVAKSSAYLYETLVDPKTADSGEVTEAAFNRAFGVNTAVWDWLDTPEQEYRSKRFDTAMLGSKTMQPADIVVDAYEWGNLPKDSIIVDVGGGIGTWSLPVVEKYPHLQLVVQDRPAVVEEGQKMWSHKLPELFQLGRVRFEGHDFFSEQPVKDASVFLLKAILHDWSDVYCTQILTQLRKSARSDTKLIIIDIIVRHTCHLPPGNEASTPSGVYSPKEAPEPLLASYGLCNNAGYVGDMTMMTMFNSQERTVKHMSSLLESTGWRIARVQSSEDPVTLFLPILALPI